MGKEAKAPEPLNVGNVTEASNKQNLQNAQQQVGFNRPDQTDPWGNTLSWTMTGTDGSGAPIYKVNQGLGGIGQQYAGGLAGLGQQYMNLASGYDPSSFSMDAFNKAQGFYDQANAPYEGMQRDQLYNRLRNQGLDPSSEAFKNATMASEDQIARNRNAFTGQAQGQFFNQGLQGTQQQANLLNPGMQFANQVLNPNYANVPGVNVSNTDVSGLYLNRQQDLMEKYKADLERQNAMWGGLAGLGKAGITGLLS